MKQLVKKPMGWKEKCLYDSKHDYKIVRIFDRWGFIINPLFVIGGHTITSTKVFESEFEAYKQAYLTVHPNGL